MIISLTTVLIVVVVVVLIGWLLSAIYRSPSIPEPVKTIVVVAIIIVAILFFLGMLNGGGHGIVVTR